jgi:Family of unknown function (DUF5996)
VRCREPSQNREREARPSIIRPSIPTLIPCRRVFARLGEFVLPYEAVRTAASPDTALLDFLQSTYEAAADAGKWDRAALEYAPGIPRMPRAIS